MSYSEREALTSLITTLIVVAFFAWRLSSQHVQGLFTGPEALQVWARSVLVLVVIGIGIAIAVTVVFHVLYAALTGEKTDDRRDERDREIDRRAITWSWYFLSFGILGTIIHLAFGATAISAMTTILGLCLGTEIFKDVFKLWHYRRGT
jgi:uncharacterized membrane protein YwzB